MKNAWRNLIAFGITSTLAVGCVVSSDDNGGGDNGGAAGSAAGSGGSAGTTTGGSAGTTTGGSAGTTTTGGAAGMGNAGGAGGATCDSTGANACETCVFNKCCAEWNACAAPENCAVGGPADDAGAMNGEFVCFQDCVIAGIAGGEAPDDAKARCGAECVTPGETLPSMATQDLIACINGSLPDGGFGEGCALDCFGG